MISDRLFLAARVVCGLIALQLLALSLIIGTMLLKGPGDSPAQGLLLLLLGGGTLALVLFVAIAPQRAAALLPATVQQPEQFVRKVMVALAALCILLAILPFSRSGP